MLELRHLRSLVAIADSRRLADAAEHVHLTQSALSHQVRALEAHYGITLFHRTSAGLRFTPAGQRLLTLARETLASVQNAERASAGTEGRCHAAIEIPAVANVAPKSNVAPRTCRKSGKSHA